MYNRGKTKRNVLDCRPGVETETLIRVMDRLWSRSLVTASKPRYGQ